ncbi:uncharacterized protein LOC111003608 [Pieris rapae]|uniref:uncharacterized protein LOC111003608 n=1 Tax=Pieris rapae TaxID=64459 RepID=UPI001E27B072|nr:uncharacterized protein LOC111003608 [Pieris rapae]
MMDVSSSVLGCVLLLQMSVILVMLNPAYDLRKIRSLFFTSSRICSLTIISYFTLVVYLGMYVPLLNISKLISNEITCDYEKLTILSRIEKNYIIAGFSLFLFIVMYGVRALDIYATRIAQMLVNANNTVFSQPLLRERRSQGMTPFSQENILPKLLKIKRSVSYETILFAKEFRALKAILKNTKKDSKDKTEP